MTRKWKLVPAKYDAGNGVVRAGMTDAMHDAFWKRFEEASQKHGDWEATNAAYNAMLSASPAPGEDVVENLAMAGCEAATAWCECRRGGTKPCLQRVEFTRAVLKALKGDDPVLDGCAR